MKCPYCKNRTLKKAIIYDVEVDYCPKCHGVWLDKGELSKIFKDVSGIFEEL